MAQFEVDYLGATVVDKRFSNPMVPWVIADVKRRRKVDKVVLRIERHEMTCVTCQGVTVVRHHVHDVTRFCHEPNNMRIFMYLVKDNFEPVLHCHLFRATEFEDVVEIFQTMKENIREGPTCGPATRSHSSAASLTALCSDISPSNSQFFEVLYVGKIKVSHRKVPDTFIDDALEKIRLHELEKSKKQSEVDSSKLRSLETGSRSGEFVAKPSDKSDARTNGSSSDLWTNLSCVDSKVPVEVELTSRTETEPDIMRTNVMCDNLRDGLNENVFVAHENEPVKSETETEKALSEMGVRRNRAGSLGVIETYKRRADEASHNRTMLFYVGRTDLRLISPDRKQVLLHKMLKDVASCIQGVNNSEHFGFISREMECYVGYVFKCESNDVADDVVSAITQSFHAIKDHKETRQPVLSCEHCPMVWYHKLCAEVEGQSEKKTQMTVLKRIEGLPSEEQDVIHTKFLGAESSDIREQNEFLMILLRAHCETKQTRHVHDTAENRSEFLNQYLGGNTIFSKAKRSLTSSFDHLLKRKGSQLEVSSPYNSKESLARRSDICLSDSDISHRRSSTVGTTDLERMQKELRKHNEAEQLKRQFFKEKSTESESSESSKKSVSFHDIATVTVNNQKIEKALLSKTEDNEEEDLDIQKTPMMNIFMKVGTPSKAPPSEAERLSVEAGLGAGGTPGGSWRQAIFNRVVTPSKGDGDEAGGRAGRKKTREELRGLWKKAINQQLLLIRMEKENDRLKARQEEAIVKRIKLEYDELGGSSKEYMAIWDLISKDNRLASSRCDSQMLLQAIRQGVPRAKRGDVWHFLAVQFCLKQPPFDSTQFPTYDTPYMDLLKSLTSFQHAILIDLGRTFPSHSYYSSPLGPGQLALFNLLKAYSLLDPQVGYCQGLSFVAGVLLLHMSEETAFLLLRHLMFRRGLRRQYLPDMAALQVQLYQLSRLLHDLYPKLYAHFDRHEIAPTLYAASWILTIFSSQFPLGFVTRVFDLLFLESTTDVIFRVALALLAEHKEQLLKRAGFEEIMEYLKTDLPDMDTAGLDRIMKRVLSMDISKQLHEYEVEYHVLQEEMATPRPEAELLRRAELENRRLTDQNLALIEQLEVVNNNVNRLEKSRGSQQASINRLETQVRNLEITIATLGDFISDMSEEYRDMDVPGDIRRIITNLELAEQRSAKQTRKKKIDKSAFLKRSKTSMGFYEKNTKLDTGAAEGHTVEELPRGTVFEAKPAETVLRGVPLKVIVDDNDEKKRHQPAAQPNLTSKITSGVSSFFNSTHNQVIKNQKNKFFQENIANTTGRTNEGFSEEYVPKRRFSSEIGSLNIKDSIIKKEKENKKDLLGEKSRVHPLDACNDVNITYNGTTKLKSLKPGRVGRANAVDLMPFTNDILCINEHDEPIDKSILQAFSSTTEKF